MIIYVPIFESSDKNIFDTTTQKAVELLEVNRFVPDIKFSEITDDKGVKVKIWIWRKRM